MLVWGPRATNSDISEMIALGVSSQTDFGIRGACMMWNFSGEDRYAISLSCRIKNQYFFYHENLRHEIRV